MGCCQASGEDPQHELKVPTPTDGPASKQVDDSGGSLKVDDVTISLGGGSAEEAPEDAPKVDPSVIMCKVGCGRPAKAGLTRKGNPFDTCCRTCVVNPGLGMHDHSCGAAAGEPAATLRPACPKGARCRQRTEDHLSAQAHPLDEDYIECCTASRIQPQQLSLKVIFDWADADGSGKLSQDELGGAYLPIQKRCNGALPPITAEAWKHMDEDGNGVVNFVEFASWAGPRLGLPLGMERLMRRLTTSNMSHPCTVIGCPCECFDGKDEKPSTKCKTCKHKCSMHQSRTKQGDVPIPEYWENHEGNFVKLVEMKSVQVLEEFQKLLDATYRPIWTRDRTRHNPTRPLPPCGFKVVAVKRNENYDTWKEYVCRRANIMCQLEERQADGKDPIELYTDVKSAAAWRDIAGKKGDRLTKECNEWYLFHGTSPAASKSICENDFRVACAGSNTGTLYGKGLYFAESITKADEYAKPEGDTYAVLVVRVIGGNVRYTDEVTPDPETLVYDCLQGPYDSVLGDREKCRNTYREFVLFDSEDVYPEYVIEYKRLYND